MSSSEDEVPSTSNGNTDEMITRIDTEINSEKGFISIIRTKVDKLIS